MVLVASRNHAFFVYSQSTFVDLEFTRVYTLIILMLGCDLESLLVTLLGAMRDHGAAYGLDDSPSRSPMRCDARPCAPVVRIPLV